jgi:hypothetical protein
MVLIKIFACDLHEQSNARWLRKCRESLAAKVALIMSLAQALACSVVDCFSKPSFSKVFHRSFPWQRKFK